MKYPQCEFEVHTPLLMPLPYTLTIESGLRYTQSLSNSVLKFT